MRGFFHFTHRKVTQTRFAVYDPRALPKYYKKLGV